MGAQTRREILQAGLAIPCFLGRTVPGSVILCTDDLLARESARGYRNLLQSCGVAARVRDLTIAVGHNEPPPALASMLRRRIDRGGWLLWEVPAAFGNEPDSDSFSKSLGIHRLPTRTFGLSDSLYVEYSWPHPTLCRTFASVTPVAAASMDLIFGYHSGFPVAGLRRLGRGGVAFLGSMLGPQLVAGDREAQQLVAALLASLGVTSL